MSTLECEALLRNSNSGSAGGCSSRSDRWARHLDKVRHRKALREAREENIKALRSAMSDSEVRAEIFEMISFAVELLVFGFTFITLCYLMM